MRSRPRRSTDPTVDLLTEAVKIDRRRARVWLNVFIVAFGCQRRSARPPVRPPSRCRRSCSVTIFMRYRHSLTPLVAGELESLHVMGETIVSYLLCMRYCARVDFRHPIEAAIPGAQGRVIAALLGTSEELNLRTIARVAGVSIAQASRVLPGLVELGMIERREVPPSSLFRLVPEHVATRALLELADARNVVMTEMGRAASKIRPAPVSEITFGSFARGDSELDSDIDVMMVRPPGVDADDDRWTETIERWRNIVSRVAGNSVEILDVDADAVAAKLFGGTQLWRDIHRDGQVVFGERLDTLADRVNA